MTWIRIDDALPENPKIHEVGALGAWVYVQGLCYSGRNLTDGFIPLGAARAMARTGMETVGSDGSVEKIGLTSGRRGQNADEIDWCARLEEAGLWHGRAEDCACIHPGRRRDGYWIHDYRRYNPTRLQVEAEAVRKDESRQIGGRARAAVAVRDAGRFTSKANQQPRQQTTSNAPANAGGAGPAFHQLPPAPGPLPLPRNTPSVSPPADAGGEPPGPDPGGEIGGNGSGPPPDLWEQIHARLRPLASPRSRQLLAGVRFVSEEEGVLRLLVEGPETVELLRSPAVRAEIAAVIAELRPDRPPAVHLVSEPALGWVQP